MQLDDIEFCLDAKDERENVVVDSNLVRSYVIDLWNKGEIDPRDGMEHYGKESYYDDDIDEVVSFEIIEQEKFTDPAQTTLPLTEGNNK